MHCWFIIFTQNRNGMIRKFLLTGTGVFLLALCSVAQDSSSQWRGPDRKGIYYETGLLKSWSENGPELLWSFEGLGAGHSSPGIGSGRIFINGMPDTTGVLFSFDMDGKLLWQIEYGEEWHINYTGTRSTPLVVDDLVYLISGMGEVFCFKAETGDVVWSVDLLEEYGGVNIQWGIAESVLIDGDNLICTPGGVEHNVVALNRHTGNIVWSSKGFGEQSAYCSPVLVKHNNTRLVITMTETSVIGIDAATGEFYWREEQLQSNKIHANTPVYENGIVYISSASSREGKSGLLALKLSDDGKSVEQLFRNEEFKNLMGGIIILDGTIYGAEYRTKNWFSVNAQTGKEKLITSDFGGGVIAYAEGLFYCYSEDGEVALVKMTPESFEIISKFAVPLGTDQHWAHPIIHDKRMYIRHGNALMAYKVGV
jgi:outer membrane protein assembly factor BamB